jgi:hypothetical protein
MRIARRRMSTIDGRRRAYALLAHAPETIAVVPPVAAAPVT